MSKWGTVKVLVKMIIYESTYREKPMCKYRRRKAKSRWLVSNFPSQYENQSASVRLQKLSEWRYLKIFIFLFNYQISFFYISLPCQVKHPYLPTSFSQRLSFVHWFLADALDSTSGIYRKYSVSDVRRLSQQNKVKTVLTGKWRLTSTALIHVEF